MALGILDSLEDLKEKVEGQFSTLGVQSLIIGMIFMC